jgi:hypothetical protein
LRRISEFRAGFGEEASPDFPGVILAKERVKELAAALDRRCASFETRAMRAPQDEVLSQFHQ